MMNATNPVESIDSAKPDPRPAPATSRPTAADIADAMARIVARVVPDDRGFETRCWIWPGATLPLGYGKIGVRGATWLTHRLSYTAAKGPIPNHLQIDHLCRQRDCCNPDHLEAVSASENVGRSLVSIGVRPAINVCASGHPRSARSLGKGGRCRLCRVLIDRRRRELEYGRRGGCSDCGQTLRSPHSSRCLICSNKSRAKAPATGVMARG